MSDRDREREEIDEDQREIDVRLTKIEAFLQAIDYQFQKEGS